MYFVSTKLCIFFYYSLHICLYFLQRKRKRKEVDEDVVSVQSLNIVPDGSATATHEGKKKRSLVKMSSLVNMLSPATSKISKRFEVNFQLFRQLSFLPSCPISLLPVSTIFLSTGILPYFPRSPHFSWQCLHNLHIQDSIKTWHCLQRVLRIVVISACWSIELSSVLPLHLDNSLWNIHG